MGCGASANQIHALDDRCTSSTLAVGSTAQLVLTESVYSVYRWCKMGCGASANQIHALDDQGAVVSKSAKRGRHKKLTNDDDDERDLISDGRGDSAASKISQRSQDSGFDDEEQRHRQSAQLLGLLHVHY